MILGEVAEVQMGYPFRSRLADEPPGHVAVVQMRDIDVSGSIDPTGCARVAISATADRHLLRKGDLLVSSRGRSNRATLVPGNLGPTIAAAPLLVVRPRSIDPDFLCWFINTPAVQSQLAARSEGTSVKMVSTEALRTLELPLPGLAAQARIAQVAALAAQEQSLRMQIAGLRQHLLNHLLTKLAHEATP